MSTLPITLVPALATSSPLRCEVPSRPDPATPLSVAAPVFSLTFIVLLAYITLEILRPEALFSASAQTPILRYVSIVLGAAFVIGRLFKPQDRLRAPQNVFIVAFLIAIPVSLLLSGVGHALGVAVNAFLDFGKIVLMYMVCGGTVTSRARLTRLIGLLRLLTLYLAIGGILTALHVVALPGFAIELGGRVRYAGVFADSNDFAQVLLVGGAFILDRAIWTGGRLSKTFWTLGALTVAAAVVFTASRGGFVGLLVLTGVAFARVRGSVQAFLISCVVVLVLVVAMPSLVVERLRGTTTDEESAKGRIAAWTDGWYMFWSKPISGVGYGRFREDAGRTAHNTLVLISSETGALGIYCWIGFFYLTFRMAMRLNVFGRGHPDYCLNATYDALLAYLSTAWFLSRAYMFLPYMLVALALSAVFLAAKERGLTLNAFSQLRPTELISVGFAVVGWVALWKLHLLAGWNL